MSVISRGSFAKEIYPGVSKWAQLAYKEYSPEWRELFEVLPSKRAYEEIVGFMGIGNFFIKGEGEGVQYKDMEQGYLKRMTPVTYALGYQITREMYEDGLYPEVTKRRSLQLARSYNHTKEVVHANVLNNGFDANFLGWDGLPLFSTAHVTKGGFTYQNRLTVDSDLSEATLEQVCIDVQGYTDPAGLIIAANAIKLAVPSELQFTAARILESQLQNDTANNAINALKVTSALSQGTCVNHFLTDPDAWFVLTDCPDGLFSVDRRSFSIDMDNDTDTQNAKYVGSGRYTADWADPRKIYGTPGAV